MWCSTCRQDVPGIAGGSADSSQVRCAKCGGTLASSPRATRPESAPLRTDDWELDEELREVRRLLRTFEASPLGDAPDYQAAFLDLPFDLLPSPHVPHAPARQAAAAEKLEPRTQKRRSSFFTWTALSLGLMTFMCGGVLLGWSFIGGRAELWTLGLPLTLAGLAALVIGLILQLESLWQSNRDTSATLATLDDQLRDLRHATTMLSTTHSSSAQSFYAHMAGGASPQLLVADLKGQLDLLATQLAKAQR